MFAVLGRMLIATLNFYLEGNIHFEFFIVINTVCKRNMTIS